MDHYSHLEYLMLGNRKNITEKYIWQPRNLGYFQGCVLHITRLLTPFTTGTELEGPAHGAVLDVRPLLQKLEWHLPLVYTGTQCWGCSYPDIITSCRSKDRYPCTMNKPNLCLLRHNTWTPFTLCMKGVLFPVIHLSMGADQLRK